MSGDCDSLVSIGLPVFNGEKGLEAAINSLLEQDYNNFEIIISDNGSTDSNPKYVKSLLRKILEYNMLGQRKIKERFGILIVFLNCHQANILCGQLMMIQEAVILYLNV